MLVARHAADANGRAEQFGRGLAELTGAVAHLRQQARRHAKQAAKFFVPLSAADIEQQRARGIAGVGGMDFSAGQPPQQKAVDGAEREFARFGRGPRTIDVIEQPGDLAGGKIRVEDQPGLGGYRGFMTAVAECLAKIGGAPVLPDNGIVDRLAGGAVPDNRGLTLIGDADAGDIAGRKPRLRHRRADGGNDGLPDFFRVVLDPAGRWKYLPEFLLGDGERLQCRIEHDRARRSRTLIDGDECGRQDTL